VQPRVKPVVAKAVVAVAIDDSPLSKASMIVNPAHPIHDAYHIPSPVLPTTDRSPNNATSSLCRHPCTTSGSHPDASIVCHLGPRLPTSSHARRWSLPSKTPSACEELVAHEAGTNVYVLTTPKRCAADCVMTRENVALLGERSVAVDRRRNVDRRRVWVGGLTIIEAFEIGESSIATATTALATTGLTRGAREGLRERIFEEEAGFTNQDL